MFFDNFLLCDAYLFKHHFISHAKSYTDVSRGLVLVECRYHEIHYNSDLFKYFKIDMPSVISGSIYKRQSEFLAGRYAAKLAIAVNNKSKCSNIHIGRNREPIWPKGIVGSISHTEDKAICLVGELGKVTNVGVDIERILDKKIALSINEQIHNKKELDILTNKGFSKEIATSIIFSAKESFFKAAYPQVGEYFGFECARVIWIDSYMKRLILKINDKLVLNYNLKKEYIASYTCEEHFVMTMIVY